MNPNLPTPFVPLHALTVCVAPALAGCKHAVQYGDGPVYVSPAVWSLMSDATPEFLHLLLSRLEVLRLPLYPWYGVPPQLLGNPGGANYAAAKLDVKVFEDKLRGPRE